MNINEHRTDGQTDRQTENYTIKRLRGGPQKNSWPWPGCRAADPLDMFKKDKFRFGIETGKSVVYAQIKIEIESQWHEKLLQRRIHHNQDREPIEYRQKMHGETDTRTSDVNTCRNR
jgi:hypothetical protein